MLRENGHNGSYILKRIEYGGFMVRILDGNSEIGAHVRSNLCFLICLRRFIKSREVTNLNLFFGKGPVSFMRAQYIYHLNKYHGWFILY